MAGAADPTLTFTDKDCRPSVATLLALRSLDRALVLVL